MLKKSILMLSVLSPLTLWALPADSSEVIRALVTKNSDFATLLSQRGMTSLKIESISGIKAPFTCGEDASSKSATVLVVTAKWGSSSRPGTMYFVTSYKPEDIHLCK